MGYHQLVQSAAQVALVRQGNVQIAQLSALNQQMALQSAHVQAQANLSQALFDGEQLVRRIALTRQHDLFAAGALAEQGMQSTQGVQVTHFHTIDEKRAWSNVQGALADASRQARSHPQLVQKLDAYRSCFARFVQLQMAVGGDPDRHVQRYESAVGHARPEPLMIACVVSLFVLSALFLLGGMTLLKIISLCVTVAFGVKCSTVHQARGIAQRALDVARRQSHECWAFMNDPQGGVWLNSIWTQHPLVLNEPPVGAPASGYRHAQMAM